jgi:hypothetical protein
VPCRRAATDVSGPIGREALDAGMVVSGAIGRSGRTATAFKKLFRPAQQRP